MKLFRKIGVKILYVSSQLTAQIALLIFEIFKRKITVYPLFLLMSTDLAITKKYL